MNVMLETRELCKSYGRLMALDRLSLTVRAGDIYGFIGPNGAGKTTTFKILATILRPDSGSVVIDGIDISKGDAVRSRIGYMPDTFGVYEDMTVYQYLDFFGAAYYIPTPQRRRLIEDILTLTDLAFKREAMVQSLSRGMQQRLGIARVLIHDPKVLILDEPSSGLDPRARIELRELLKELARMGKTILISSHILSELEEVCDQVGIIEQGRLVFEGARLDLLRQLAGQAGVLIETAPEDTDKAFQLLQAAPFAEQIVKTGNGLSLRVKAGVDDLSPIPELLIRNGCRLLKFQREDVSLEDAFLSLTKGKLA